LRTKVIIITFKQDENKQHRIENIPTKENNKNNNMLNAELCEIKFQYPTNEINRYKHSSILSTGLV